MPEAQEHIEVGLVTKPHGVRGAVKLRLHNPDSDALSDLGRLHLETSSGERRRIEGIVAHSAGSPVARVEGVASMEDSSCPCCNGSA